MVKLERFNDNSFIFDHQPDGDFVVVYPTKQRPYFSFYIHTFDDDQFYELEIPKEQKMEIIGQIKNMNLDNYWEDLTDWTQVVCR